MNFDFKKKAMDEPFTDDEIAGMSGMQAMRDRVVQMTGRNPTPRDFIEVTRRGRPREAIVGSGKDVADRLEKWFVERACDGFVVAATHIPGAFEDFVRFVVPELQRRGIYHKDYTGTTLRENLGLPHPPIGWWKPRGQPV
jgi:alkanesulfonate monooxygenase SsuD/methylene tetrahydromethanopterin reductase-like flavin-dependent oxidoreductase (luciferase family)